MMKRVFKKLPDGRVIYTFESASVEAPEKAVMPQPKPKHIGGGWYELPDGQKVRKKDLEAGD